MQTIVIGGGISGLVCTYRLRQMGIPAVLLEQADRVGGLIESVEQDGFLFELGPQSFLSTEALRELIDELGLTRELLQADPRAPRYVLAGGRLRRVPLGPRAFLTTSLLGPGTKLRFLLEALGKSQPPESDESVADFVRRKFGKELLEHLVEPFVSGIHAGDPEKLSLRNAFPTAYQWERDFGSVVRGALKSRPPKEKPRPTLCSFRKGVATLVRALSAKLGASLHCGARVESIHWGKADAGSPFELQVTGNGRTEFLPARVVVLATEAPSVGRLLAGIEYGESFAEIEYAPVAVVGAGYRQDQIGRPTEGFGFLVARQEGFRLLGTVWNSSLFPDRAPEGMVNFTSFAGGATDPTLCQLGEERIAETVLGELAAVMRITGAPATRMVRCYDRALPQYNLGHSETIARVLKRCAALPGLFLTGNYFEGPSVGACVEHALRTAQLVQQYLASMGETSRAHGAG